MPDPNSPDEWLALSDQHAESAQLLLKGKATAGQAYFHAGIAVECAVKAVIMSRLGLNRWPRPGEDDWSHSHSLNVLLEKAGIVIGARHPLAVNDRSERSCTMAKVELDEARLKAGAEYLSALRSIGLDPEGLFWAYEAGDKQFYLVLVTEFMDSIGPQKVSKLVLDAYNASLTPKEIDPFNVLTMSPRHELFVGLANALSSLQIKIYDIDPATGKEGTPYYASDVPEATLNTLDGLSLYVGQTYVVRVPKTGFTDAARRWKFVEQKLERLAA